MKLKLLIAICLTTGYYSLAQNVTIPDAIFKAALVGNSTINSNGDSEIQLSEASAYSGSINVSGIGVADLTGIEAFTEIVSLQAFNSTAITAIDVSQNTKLEQLLVENTGISGTLDLSMMTQLTDFKGHTTGLTAINMANGNNANVTRFNVANATSLACLQVDAGFNPSLLWDIPVSTIITDACPQFTCVVNIPDANFKAALVGDTNINTNGNTEIECSEASAASGLLSVNGLSINDLTGIEAFTGLTQLECSNNNISMLNISALTSLVAIDARNNQLTALDVSSNTSLFSINVNNNQLTALDVSGLSNLEFLRFRGNMISAIDLSSNHILANIDGALNNLTTLNFQNNPVINTISAFSNQLSSIDLPNVPELQFLFVQNNPLTTIDISNAPDLLAIAIDNTSITTIDMSNNPVLSEFTAANSALTALNLSNSPSLFLFNANNNELIELNVANGNNSGLLNFTATGNPNLSCIQIDSGFTPPAGWNKDATASYSDSCAVCTVNIPDANFKAALVADTSINTNGNTEIECSEASAFTGTIVVGGMSISDLTGIETFTAITGLQCGFNQLTTLDVSNNTALMELFCNFNQLSSLDISNNINLVDLACNTNQISALDVSNNSALTFLNLNENQLTSFDVSNNTALNTLFVNSNQLTSLNIANGNNTNIPNINFRANNNPNLTCIEVDDVAYSNATWTNIDSQTSFSTDCNTDTTPPVAVCQNITVQLDATGNASIIPSQIDNGSTDDTGVASITLDNTSFDCSNVGANTVTLTVTDAAGNSDTCTATVDILDNVAPTITCPANSTVTINQGDLYTLTDYIGNGSVTVIDNCSVISTTQDPVAGTMLAGGTYAIEFESEDVSGNISTCTLNLIVDEILGVNDVAFEKVIRLYPNPASDVITISSEILISEVTLFDVTGAKVMVSNQTTVDVSTLASGLYLVQIISEDGATAIKRLIKQ